MREKGGWKEERQTEAGGRERWTGERGRGEGGLSTHFST